MAVFSNNAVTDKGRILLAESQVGALFVPTKIVMGSGTMPSGSTPRSMTAVATPVVQLSINKKRASDDGKVIIGGIYSNASITEAFYFRELGLYAQLQLVDGSFSEEVLYAYANAGSSADLMAAASSAVIEKQIDLVTYIGSDTQIDLTIESGAYIPFTDKGAPGGVAALGDDGKVPAAQLPAMDFDPAGSAAAVQTALSGHTGDNVRHLTAAERTAWNAKAAGDHTHTAAQVGAVAKTGDTMTGDLTIKKSALPSLNFGTDGAGTATIFKNASSSVEDGLHIKDVDTDGTYAALRLKKIEGLASCLSLNFDGTSYNVYHAGNKPTTADIGAAVKYRYTATIPTGTWTAVSGGGYYKDITVSGITAAMTPCVGVVQTSDVAASELMVEEFGNNIRRIETMAGKIRVYTRSDGAAPSVNIPIQLVGTV